MNRKKKNYLISKDTISPVEALKGIYRRTLVYNEKIMLCYFRLNKGSEVPLHSHEQHQVGYVIKGKLNFFTSDYQFIAKKGDSYIFDSNEEHGARVLTDSEVIDIFSPSREDYI
ncbi:MAG: cupin domain-containing protein [Candidatus Lokiarchaeota archaeon]|nr:cupin domain-containing protein [Candidatus Lokiarchaeota archaeon]